jgi:hypothetical protein
MLILLTLAAAAQGLMLWFILRRLRADVLTVSDDVRAALALADVHLQLTKDIEQAHITHRQAYRNLKDTPGREQLRARLAGRAQS